MITPTPPLTALYLYLTQGCNLACRHCYLAPKLDPDGSHFPTLPLGTLEQALDEVSALGLKRVKLTGGEPLLHPRIRDILALIQRRGLDLIVETNGVLLTSELVAAIKASNTAFVSVSLDGADAATHDRIRGVAGTFDKAVAAIKMLAAANVPNQIIMSLMEDNIHQVEAVIALAESTGARSVKFNIVQPMERGAGLHKRGSALDIPRLIALCRRIDGELAARTSVRLIPHIPPAFRSLRKIADKSSGRCGILNIMGILPSGTYALCGVGETVADLAFGHAGVDPLAAIWSSHPILQSLRRDLPEKLEGVCGRCVMKWLCLGSCVAQNYYSSNSLLAPFWFCMEAERQGHFPSARLGAKASGTI